MNPGMYTATYGIIITDMENFHLGHSLFALAKSIRHWEVPRKEWRSTARPRDVRHTVAGLAYSGWWRDHYNTTLLTKLGDCEKDLFNKVNKHYDFALHPARPVTRCRRRSGRMSTDGTAGPSIFREHRTRQ